ncbi:hypothetical protein LCGC14_0641530 [marine sediment metagenome]|uniref:Nuclease associated modular domain-containing protein n=1 Tax=marine sediment metagenome TaxID=412755 RepID=A0A0F9U7G4_9ZZZZ|nr:hypothetical protein [archaeon]
MKNCKKYSRGKHPNSHKHGLFKKGHKTNVGRVPSKKTRGKISKANKGKAHKKGWNHSSISKKKMREEKLGEKNPQWKGGITPLYKRIYQSFKYRQWRSDIFTRDEFTCQDCGKNKCSIVAHHIKGFSEIISEYKIKTIEQAMNCDELWNINNGKTLCKKCHKKTESYGKHFEER